MICCENDMELDCQIDWRGVYDYWRCRTCFKRITDREEEFNI